MIVEVFKGSHSRKVHSVDLSAWIRDGWEVKQEPMAVVVKPVEEPTIATPKTDNDTFTAELEALSWQELKALASDLGIDKPDEKSWAEFIPDIVAAKLA